MKTVLERAIAIARKNLADCMTTVGIAAGSHHFVDLWARDSLFATFGLRSKSDAPSVRTTIETFLRYQRRDGLIPYRVMRSRSTIGKYFGKPSYLRFPEANYRSHQSGGTVPDGGLLTVISSATYVRSSGDTSFAREHFTALLRCMDWYDGMHKGGLIREWFQCEWADGVLKFGLVLYTNILYVKALRDMEYLAGRLGEKRAVREFGRRGDLLHAACIKTFWNGRFLSDWVDWRRHDYFASHANFLAIVFDIVTPKQARSILATAARYSLTEFTVETNYPAYPWWRIPVIQVLSGMADYHNRGCLWLQPGIMYVIALQKQGYTEEARAFLRRIAAQIVRFGKVCEVYEKNGSPVARAFYTSEGPFAWSAGLFVWAADLVAVRPRRGSY